MAARFDWEAIEAEYRTGRFSLRQLADRHGPSEAAIRKKIKAQGWKKDLTQKVRERTREKITREALPPEAREALSDDDEAIVEHAANENSAVVHGHRKLLGRWRGIADRYAEQLEAQLATGKIDVQLKSGDVAEIDVPLDYVGKAMANGTAALEKVVKLERQSYGLDLEGDKQASHEDALDALDELE
ncbi:hypothetical protein GCM10027040_27580 [Halomonas shantousis]